MAHQCRGPYAHSSLEALTRTREADLATTMPADQANAIIAYLRSQPQAVNEAVPGADRFAVARQRLAASQRAYADEDLAQAKSLRSRPIWMV